MGKFLKKSERNKLLRELKLEDYARYSDRIKTILLLDQGKNYQEIAEFLFINERTARNYKKNFEEGGLEQLIMDDYEGGKSYLTLEQQEELKEYLSKNLYRTAAEIVKHIKSEYDVKYTVGSIRHLLKRLGFVYKKPKSVPGKADKKAQAAFVKKLKRLKKSGNPLYFADGVHPQHNTFCEYGWILKGEDFELKSNTGRSRVNINGAINANNPKDVVAIDSDSVNAQSTIKMLKKIEKKNKKAKVIYVVVDNARYYKCHLVKDYLQNSKIRLIFLPPYSPNLNLIERLWKVMNKAVLYNRYYEKFDQFKKAIMDFFQNIHDYRNEIQRVLTFKFQLVGF